VLAFTLLAFKTALAVTVLAFKPVLAVTVLAFKTALAVTVIARPPSGCAESAAGLPRHFAVHPTMMDDRLSNKAVLLLTSGESLRKHPSERRFVALLTRTAPRLPKGSPGREIPARRRAQVAAPATPRPARRQLPPVARCRPALASPAEPLYLRLFMITKENCGYSDESPS
jgi:hypothetical protein